MEPQYDDEIDLTEVFYVLLNGWKKLLLSAVLVAVIVGGFNKYVLTPQYSSTTTLYVFPKGTSLSNIVDIQMGESLTQDYMKIITGPTVVEKVITNLNLDMEYEELMNNITVENPVDTRILEITVVDESAKRAKLIADEFAKVSSKYISNRMDQDAPNILEKGRVSDKPIGPNIKKNTCIGFLVGFCFMATILIVTHLMSDTLMNPEDVERRLGLDTLAEIPESTALKEERQRKSKKKGKK